MPVAGVRASLSNGRTLLNQPDHPEEHVRSHNGPRDAEDDERRGAIARNPAPSSRGMELDADSHTGLLIGRDPTLSTGHRRSLLPCEMTQCAISVR